MIRQGIEFAVQQSTTWGAKAYVATILWPGNKQSQRFFDAHGLPPDEVKLKAHRWCADMIDDHVAQQGNRKRGWGRRIATLT